MEFRKPTAGIVMAAGMSTRFGRPKLFAELDGKPLFQWVVEACLASRLAEIVVVVGPDADRIAKALSSRYDDRRLRTVANPLYAQGMSASLRYGLSAVEKSFPAVMFLLADQPLVSANLIDRLLQSFWASGKDICFPVHGGRRGHPVVFGSRFYDRLMGVAGDKGAREVIRAHPEAALSVAVDDPLAFCDIDTEKDLEVLRTLSRGIR